MHQIGDFWIPVRLPVANGASPEFDDSGWKSGAAPLGYDTDGAEGLGTEVAFGDDAEAKHAATFFRKTFEIAELTIADHFALSLAVDDGAVVYLNGTEVKRLRMDEGEITEKTFSDRTQSGGAKNYEYFEIASDSFAKGKNVLAISVHQSSCDQQRIIHVDATLSAMSAEEIASVMFPHRVDAITAGYNEDVQAFMQKYEAAPDEEKLVMRDQYPSLAKAQRQGNGKTRSILPETSGSAEGGDLAHAIRWLE